MDLTTLKVVAPEGSAPSLSDYKSPVLLLNYRAIKGQGIRSAYATAALTTRPLLFVHYSGTSAKTTACLSFHDSLLIYGRNFLRFRYCCIARRRPVAPGERLWLKRYSHAVYTAVYSPLQDSSKSQALGTSPLLGGSWQETVNSGWVCSRQSVTTQHQLNHTLHIRIPQPYSSLFSRFISKEM